MKKILVFTMALVLLFSIVGSAMAAQVMITVDNTKDAAIDQTTGNYTYRMPIPTSFGNTVALGTYVNRFNPDGKTNYPYEIYLPNEQNPAQYRIHSNYSKATDACASCHATHTAVGNSLLQWYTTYDTCMACHDGTVTTTYNVKDGVIGATGKSTFGGMFGTGTENSLSSHNVTGAVEIAAAPGGSSVAENITKADGQAATKWTTQFGCESCHSPHGAGGNARILNPDPNFVATQNKKTAVALTQIDSVTYAAYPAADTTQTPYTMIKGYPYAEGTIIKDNGNVVTPTIDNSLGYTLVKFAVAPTGPVTADFYPSVKVKMAIGNYLQATESVQHVSGMNTFCSACHTDYNTEGFVNADGKVNAGSGSAETGTYSKAHRHQVGFYYGYSATKLAAANMVLENGNMECLTCHVAHGTSTDYWTRTVGSTSTTAGRLASAYLTDDTLTELAGSSALKRLPNMGTCEACHAKGDGNDGYNANTGQTTFSPVAGVTNGLFTQTTAKLAGITTCQTCHKEYVAKFLDTLHPYMLAPLKISDGKYYTLGKNIGTEAQASLGDLETKLKESVTEHGYNLDFDKVFTAGNLPINGKKEGERRILYPVTSDVKDTNLFTLTPGNVNKGIADGLTGGGGVDNFYENAQYTAPDGQSTYTYFAEIGVAEWSEANGWEVELWYPATVIEYDAALGNKQGRSSYYDEFTTSYPQAGTNKANGANGACMNCHVTLRNNNTGTMNLMQYVDYFKGTAAKPSWDMGVTCEGCHGEASNHIKQPSQTNIFNPSRLGANMQDQSRVCGRCHNQGKCVRKTQTMSQDQATVAFFGAWSPWKLTNNTDNVTTMMGAYIDLPTTSNPFAINGGVAADYTTKNNWTFGPGWDNATNSAAPGKAWSAQPHVEYISMTANAHFTKNVVSCETCHNSHNNDNTGHWGNGQLKLAPGALCATCHDSTFTVSKYMPNANENNMFIAHDFGTLIDATAKDYKNTQIRTTPYTSDVDGVKVIKPDYNKGY